MVKKFYKKTGMYIDWQQLESLPEIDTLIDIGVGPKGTEDLYRVFKNANLVLIDPIDEAKEYANKLVYLMGVDKARFRNPVIPDCELHLEIEAVRSHGRVWKYKGTAKVDGKRMADAEWSATIVDRK